MQPFPVIAGPTAGGKSDLAVEVALLLGGGAPGAAEIVTADAFQVYRALDIGTAKPTPEERRGIPHHLIDVVEPTERFTAAQWLAAARAAIADTRARGRMPIVVGGTHLYIKALLDGLFDGPEPDATLRAELQAIPQGTRRAELERVDPAAAARIHANDDRRTIRALEVFRQTGRPISAHQRQWDRVPADSAADPTDQHTDRGIPGAMLVTLDWPTPELNRRINERVRSMIARGLLGEVRGLHESARLGPQAREALGYKQLLTHLRGECTLDDAVERIKIETRRFAKNQRTWLRRLSATPGALRIDAGATPPESRASEVIARLHTTGDVRVR
ncbi:MAG: tRNA (adenosine(37)-N6)-dimethylallyltransferase MiaA [Phycisphaerales bacterium]